MLQKYDLRVTARRAFSHSLGHLRTLRPTRRKGPRWVRDGLSAKPFEGPLVAPDRTRGLRPTGGSSAVSCDGRGPNARGGTIGQTLDIPSRPNVGRRRVWRSRAFGPSPIDAKLVPSAG